MVMVSVLQFMDYGKGRRQARRRCGAPLNRMAERMRILTSSTRPSLATLYLRLRFVANPVLISKEQ